MELLIAPHNDDEVLFACYTLIERKPMVVVCLEGHGQRWTTAEIRINETACAMGYLGLDWEQAPFRDDKPDWAGLQAHLAINHLGYDRVYAPAWEDGGHEQHNRVAEIARVVYGAKVHSYMTYRRGHRRSRSAHEVAATGGMRELKIKAMSCFESQIRHPSTEPWFNSVDRLREWML